MSEKRNRRSDDEWFQIITECRQSGLSDRAWCEQHDIKISTFYNAAVRLRKKACEIPAPSKNACTMDFTSRQDVVRVDICPEKATEAAVPARKELPDTHLDNSYTIELSAGSFRMKLSNNADPELLCRLLRVMGATPC